MTDYGTPGAIGTQQIPRYEFGSTIIDLSRGATFGSTHQEGGNQAVAYAKGGQPAVAVWNDAGELSITENYPLVPNNEKELFDAFFGAAGVNFMESNFNFYPNANKPSTVYDVRLASAKGYIAKEMKSGGTRRLWNIRVQMIREVT